MSDENSSLDAAPNNSAGGIVAEHPAFTAHPVLAGPTTSDRRNTIRAGIVPIACWRLDDIRFEFSASFGKSDIAREMTLLAKLVKDHPGAPLSIFGHADPIGSEEFNKKLSGRRAAVIYAMLTRNTDIWEDIYSQTGKFTTVLQDDAWGLKAVKTMLEALGYSPGPLDDQMRSQTRDAVRNFQTDQGFEGRDVDGDPGPQTRAKLFLAYMDQVCRDEDGQPFKMAPSDFLGEGADQAGKGDYQGCSEFNPVLLFSQEESDRFAQARDRTERNAANAPNRRVLALLFRPGSKVNVERWPCPRAKEGIDACKKRLWSDAPRRRSIGTERRLFDEAQDTFACRFYQRISDGSPCERMVPPLLTVEIFFDVLLARDNLKDRYQLRSADGSFVRMLGRGDAVPFMDKVHVLRFTQVIPGKRYSLFQHMVTGETATIFMDVPFDSLHNYGPATPQSRPRMAAEAEPEPEPEFLSEDPNVLPGPEEQLCFNDAATD